MRLTVLAATLGALAATSASAQTVDPYSPLPPPPLPDDSGQGVPSPPTGAWEPAARVPPPPPPVSSAEPDGTAAPPAVTRDRVRAPGPRVRRTRVTTGPLTPLALGMDGLSFELEHAFGEHASFFLGPRFGAFPKTHFSLSSGLRFFPSFREPAPAGFWIGPELWTAFEYNAGVDAATGASYGYSDVGVFALAMAGYTIVYRSGFTMSFGAGLGGGVSIKEGTGLVVPNPVTSNRIASVTGTTSVPSIALHWNIGYAF